LARADGLGVAVGLGLGVEAARGVALAAGDWLEAGTGDCEDAIAEAGDDRGAAGLEIPDPLATESGPAALAAALLPPR
jgi:hypothetical protein